MIPTTYPAFAEAYRAADLPERCHAGLADYIMKGAEPGGFLCALLGNDLRDAIARADDENRKRIVDYVAFLNSKAPARCWGSRERVDAWIDKGGLQSR